ncbi:MAG: type VI secretion system baseplate subunit TssE [Enterobacteriaceae bacterium]|jgi:type VI secretion system protein ImpF|nr:type VI secretion system baseplate subunit TssE [Enterobacteriaceae bacterium]
MKNNTDSIYGDYAQRNNAKRVTTRDKMQSSLLDRLTDDEPGKKKESARHYVVSNRILRQNILRDLQWLFNTINGEAEQDLTSFSAIRRSVYNFGLSPLAGQNMSDIEWEDIQHKIIEAIHTFEPRIIPDSLEVNCIADQKSLSVNNTLSIEVKGFLWCIPWPLEFLFRSDIDLENGYFSIKDAR